MVEIPFQEVYLLKKRLPDRRGSVRQGLSNSIAVLDLHRERLDVRLALRFFSSPFMWVIISPTVSNGP